MAGVVPRGWLSATVSLVPEALDGVEGLVMTSGALASIAGKILAA